MSDEEARRLWLPGYPEFPATNRPLLAVVQEELARLTVAMHKLERWRKALEESATMLRTGGYSDEEVRAHLHKVGLTEL